MDEEEFAWLERVCAEAEAKRARRGSEVRKLPPSMTAPLPEAPLLPVISFDDGPIAYLDNVNGLSSAATLLLRLASGTATTVGFDIVSSGTCVLAQPQYYDVCTANDHFPYVCPPQIGMASDL